METKANYVAVGFFTMAVIIASFAFIYWVAKLDGSTPQRPINVSIIGAVTGLAPGSEVHFNGIKVGQVNRVVFNPNDPREVFALAQINEDTPVRADTTATIGSQGLTGIAYISLKGGSPDAQSLFDQGVEGAAPVIRAKPSAVADILETVRDVSDKANEALGTLKEFIDENRAPVSKTVSNIEAFLTAKEEQEIVEAIRLAEKQTSGEIRIHIESTSQIDAIDRAMDVFHELKMDNTKLQNGVLIYVAVNDRNFVIFGDKGINDVVPSDFWDCTKDVMQELPNKTLSLFTRW